MYCLQFQTLVSGILWSINCSVCERGLVSMFTCTYFTDTNNVSRTTNINPFTADPVNALHFAIPYWSNPPFLIFDIRALWRSVLSARVPECQKLKMVG